VDYHPSFQEVAFVDTETGEFDERHLDHSSGQAEKFYRDLKQRGVNVRVGIEATGHAARGDLFAREIRKLGDNIFGGLSGRQIMATVPQNPTRSDTPFNR